MSSQNDIVQEGKLLSEQERIAFKMIATGNDLHGQRAIALLAVDEGATQAEAARQAGLTVGQVKYWLGKFRQVRMEIFPEQILETNQTGSEDDIDATMPLIADKSEKSQKKKKKQKSSKKSKTGKGKKSKDKKNKSKQKGKDKKNKAKN